MVQTGVTMKHWKVSVKRVSHPTVTYELFHSDLNLEKIRRMYNLEASDVEWFTIASMRI